MNKRKTAGRGQLRVVLLTFVVAVFLNLVPYPDWLENARPDWVTLVLFYWCLALPERIGVGAGWGIGLTLDILYYSLLGQHAIGKAFVALIAVSTYRRTRMYHLWRQCLIVFVITSVDLFFTVWVYHVTSGIEIKPVYWLSAFTTALMWPVIYTVLRFVRHKSRINR